MSKLVFITCPKPTTPRGGAVMHAGDPTIVGGATYTEWWGHPLGLYRSITRGSRCIWQRMKTRKG